MLDGLDTHLTSTPFLEAEVEAAEVGRSCSVKTLYRDKSTRDCIISFSSIFLLFLGVAMHHGFSTPELKNTGTAMGVIGGVTFFAWLLLALKQQCGGPLVEVLHPTTPSAEPNV